jgi:hypothetical protein
VQLIVLAVVAAALLLLVLMVMVQQLGEQRVRVALELQTVLAAQA